MARRLARVCFGLVFCSAVAQARAPLVLLTDFGTQDGAVAAMKGVAYSVSQELLLSDSGPDWFIEIGKD